jgi:hypothetical protein
MAELAQVDWKAKGSEARIRALLEDVTEYHVGIYPKNRLALAVWYAKSPSSQDQYLLELFSGLPIEREKIETSRFSLLWKTGSESPPFVNLSATTVDHFSKLWKRAPAEVAAYQENSEVIYFDKKLLSPEMLSAFHVITEPHGLMKGWYIEAEEYAKSKSVQAMLSRLGHVKPHFGFVKTEESPDFENCRGLLHVEVNQRWLPLSPEGIQPYTYYSDYQKGQPVYFLFEGGSLYQVLKFEVKAAPEYAERVLEKTRNGRYPEVYLRAVHPSIQPAA